jgi:hypothetical protein
MMYSSEQLSFLIKSSAKIYRTFNATLDITKRLLVLMNVTSWWYISENIS